MNIEETLDWMCKDMAFWYMQTGDAKEIIYPITEDKQQLVERILNEDADLMIYGQNFYTIDKDISMTVNKISYTYYLKKASAYKKKRGKLMLPYDWKDDNMVIIKKLLTYYQKANTPYSLIIVDDVADVKDDLTNILNPFSYINVSLGKMLIHKDIVTKVSASSIILITSETEEKLLEKRLKVKECIQNQDITYEKIKIINDSEFDIDYFQNILLPT